MMKVTLLKASIAVTSIISTVMMLSGPATARASCAYIAIGTSGQTMAYANASARKGAKACQRAKRRCNRKLERQRRRGKAGRGTCVRQTEFGS